MDATHGDRVAKLFATAVSPVAPPSARAGRARRRRLAAVGLAAHTGTPAAAQEATPAAGAAGEKVQYLFVQSFQSGSLAPKAGEDGTFTLTLEQGLGQTDLLLRSARAHRRRRARPSSSSTGSASARTTRPTPHWSSTTALAGSTSRWSS